MSETASESVDLVVTSPPYNIGTVYATNSDRTDTSAFEAMMRQVIGECSRVLKHGGKLVIECSDTTFHDGIYTLLSAQLAHFAVSQGCTLVERHVIFTHTEQGQELRPDSHWTKPFTTTDPAHANSHQIMVFQKGGGTFDAETGKILYYQYSENQDNHPCPYAPETITFVLDHYFSAGDTVLDPFMGVARLGQEVLKRGGTFIGYELEKAFCDTAQEILQQ